MAVVYPKGTIAHNVETYIERPGRARQKVPNSINPKFEPVCLDPYKLFALSKPSQAVRLRIMPLDHDTRLYEVALRTATSRSVERLRDVTALVPWDEQKLLFWADVTKMPGDELKRVPMEDLVKRLGLDAPDGTIRIALAIADTITGSVQFKHIFITPDPGPERVVGPRFALCRLPAARLVAVLLGRFVGLFPDA